MNLYGLKGRSYLILLAVLIFITGCVEQNSTVSYNPGTDWPAYLGGKNSNQYSSLSQITPENVHLLETVWKYESEGGMPGDRTQIQCNPIIIDGVLFGTSPTLKVFALNAATGERFWQFDTTKEKEYARNVNRGVAYWSDGTEKRIFFSAGPFLYSLNAETGELDPAFGDDGKVSLKQGLGENVNEKYVIATSPGVIYQDLIIIGSRVSENADAAPGNIRAFNVKTGELEWVFHTIPHPGEFGYESWPKDAWKNIGGANSWAGMSLDEERGMVFIPTGSAAFDFWGGNRKGENLFANCLLALNAATGERIWHYQTVHHDIWDRDLPAPPNLITVNHEGKMIDAVAQITKSGFVFLLDRETGEPLFPIEERPVPESDLEGEEIWPTQPFPLKPPPFSPQSLTMENITDISPESRDYAADMLQNVRTGKQFIPPSTDGTVVFPGFDGGGEWGGAAFDEESGFLYVNGSILPWILTMIEVEPDDKGSKAHPGAKLYQVNCAMCHGQNLEGKPAANYPGLNGLEQRMNRAEILKLLNTGKGFMPSYQHLKDDEKRLLISYLLEEQETDAHLRGMKNNEGEVPYTHTGYNRFTDPHGYPAVQPPWGELSAIDLNKGEILWQVPLGEFPELTKKGIPKTGTENYGGPAVTAGGLIFIAASKDEHFRVFDKKTGEELWKYKLPAGGYATPAVYEVEGRQFVVIACGGGKMGTKSGDSYIAFALSEK